MNRPNLSTSPMGVQRYVADLERRLADAQAMAVRAVHGIHADEDQARALGRVVAVLERGHRGQGDVPLARLMEAVTFAPDDDTRFRVRWRDDYEALEVMANHQGSSGLRIVPQVSNVIRIERGPR